MLLFRFCAEYMTAFDFMSTTDFKTPAYTYIAYISALSLSSCLKQDKTF
jgi:hypothetical protein